MPQIAGKQIKDGTITATQVDTTNGTISTVNAGDSASEGAGSGLSRRDHQHAVSTAAASTLDGDSTNTEGSASSLARSDHTHAITTAAAVGVSNANAEGTAAGLARADHTHKLQELQESITTEAITGSDTAISDTLDNTPRTGSTVRLYLNGVQQQEGATKDFTRSGTTITWLASSGTAVDLETSDVLIAVYSI